MAENSVVIATPTSEMHTAVPIVIEAGSVRRRLIRQLKLGKGRLVGEVAQVVAEVRSSLGPEAAAKEFVPIVVVYRRKRKRRRALPFFPLLS